MEKLPIREAAQANALLESGQVIGNIVLVAPELLYVFRPAVMVQSSPRLQLTRLPFLNFVLG